MDLYGRLFRSVLLPVWETHVRRRPVIERLRQLQRTQWASPDELHAIQSAEIARLVEHAYKHVQLYRARMSELGLTPADVRTPEDLMKLPILRRSDLRSSPRDRESTASPLPTIRKQTSGTTGEPLLFGFEPDSEHWRRAVRFRGYEWAGYRHGDRALYFWGAPPVTKPQWKERLKVTIDQRLRREHYVPCAVMTKEHLDEVVASISGSPPQVLVCYSQAGAELARYIINKKLRTWSSIPTICGAEPVSARDRADLEEAFGPVFESYGCREVMMIAGECDRHDGLHVNAENLVVEIVVNDNGRERLAREGETGEVVLTDLHNYGMPFIRYANGDTATAGSPRRCACGRSLPRIKAVQGRVSATLRDGRGGAVSGVSLGYLFYDVSSAVRQFQVVQHRDRTITIRVVQYEELPASALERIRAHAASLLSGVSVNIELVADLPRNPAGKHNLVVVEPD